MPPPGRQAHGAVERVALDFAVDHQLSVAWVGWVREYEVPHTRCGLG